jgi:hypothetical protein
VQPAQPQPLPPPPGPYYRQPYYQQPYFVPPAGPNREARLKEARARRTRAIVLMAIGVPMSVAGIAVSAWAFTDATIDTATEIGWGFVGITLGVVGVTLWAPGAASFVKSSHDVKEWSKPEPMPPGPRGF